MKIKVLIEGMSCGNCANHVTEALGELKGVSNVEVKLEEKFALIEAKNSIAEDIIKSAIDEAGYEVVGVEVL